MSPIQLYCAISGTINALTSTTLGLYVLYKNPRPLTNRTFTAFTLCVGFWSFSYVLWVLSKESTSALFWNRMLMAGCIPIPAFFLHFVVALLDINVAKRRIVRLSYAWSTMIFLLNLTPLVVAGVERKVGFRFWANPGPFFHLYLIHFMTSVFYAHYLMYRRLEVIVGNHQNQVRYVFFGTIFAFTGGSTNFPLWYNIPIPPIGNALVAVYVAMVTYAILQHQLLDISVVIRRSLVYSILVTLLTAGYFGLVYAIEGMFQTTFGYHSVWVSVSAFALMALLFQPLKIGIQRLVDWVIFRVPHEEIIKRMERLEQETRQTEKLRSVATLAAGLCHELRNPLQIIQTHAEFIPERYNDPQFRDRCTEVMKTEITRINDLLRQLMEFAKPKTPAFQRLEPHKIMDSTLDFLNNDFVKRQVHLEKRYDANGALIQADPDQLRQVILNLILNALEAIGKHGKIIVATRQENGRFTLQVSDTGPGIKPEILPKLFEPFTTTKPNGNGLGLSIVHSIVREHRGTISVQSQSPTGTIFTIQFPLA